MWHNEVKQHLQSTRNPKKVKKQQINQILTKLAPTDLDADFHLPEFDIATVGAITAIKFGDATTAAASDDEIRLCFQTLGSDSATPKAQALGGFTWQRLKSPQIGMCGRRASTSNSIKSTNKACLEIQSILQHLILMQSSSAQHGSVPSKEMELNNPCN